MTNPDKATIDQKVAAIKAVSVPFKAALEAVINATEVNEVLAEYDNGVNFNREQIAKDAALFVLKGLAGALCYNVIDGRRKGGATMFNKALDDVDEAAERDASFRSEKSADQLTGRISWAAQMDVQQSYRLALQEFTLALYTAMTKERYHSKTATSRTKPDSPEQSIADKLKEKRHSAAA